MARVSRGAQLLAALESSKAVVAGLKESRDHTLRIHEAFLNMGRRFELDVAAFQDRLAEIEERLDATDKVVLDHHRLWVKTTKARKRRKR